MKRKWLWVLGGAVVLVLVGFLVYLALRPNPHYLTGLKYLKIKEFDNAESEFRLCLEEEENNLDAQALLVYAHLRKELNNLSEEPESTRTRIVTTLQETVPLLFLSQQYRFSFDSEEDRKNWVKQIEEGRRILRERLRELKIYTRGWEDVEELAYHGLRLLSNLKVDSDDPYDWFFQAVALALLARSGNEEAASRLVKQGIAKPETVALFYLAGSEMIPPLRAELQNKESLLRQGGLLVLRTALLPEQAIKPFALAHPQARKMRKEDFRGKDKLYWEANVPQGEEWRKRFLKMYWTSEVFEKEKLPLEVFSSEVTSWQDGEEAIALISAYDPAVKSFCGRFFLWDNETLSWEPLKLSIRETLMEEFRSPHIFGSLVYDEKEGCLRFSLYRGITQRVKETKQYSRSVIRYREETDFWGNRRLIPYSTVESVPYTESRLEDRLITEEYSFTPNPKKKELRFLKGKRALEEVSSSDEEDLSENKTVSNSSVGQGSGLCPDSQIRYLTEQDLAGHSAWELDIMRNEIYARHGRPFAEKKYQDYFMSQPWYQVNPNYSDSLLSFIEKRNARFILEYQRRMGLTD